MVKLTKFTSLASALGLLMAVAILASPVVYAEENPFALSDTADGTVIAGSHDKCGEGKCGDGKCGDSKKAKCGEGKCGSKEGKCEGKRDKKEGKCGEGKCSDSKKGKCGEGKCGDGK